MTIINSYTTPHAPEAGDGSALWPRIAELRLDLVAERVALWDAEQLEKIERADAEQRAIAIAGDEKALGPNAESRARALLLALDTDTSYRLAWAEWQRRKANVARIEAEIEGLCDQRREREWRVRERMIDAMLATGTDWEGQPWWS